MSIEVKIKKSAEESQNVWHLYSARIGPSSRKGFDGLYIFSLGCKLPSSFKEAGVYTFLFTLVSDALLNHVFFFICRSVVYVPDHVLM